PQRALDTLGDTLPIVWMDARGPVIDGLVAVGLLSEQLLETFVAPGSTGDEIGVPDGVVGGAGEQPEPLFADARLVTSVALPRDRPGVVAHGFTDHADPEQAVGGGLQAQLEIERRAVFGARRDRGADSRSILEQIAVHRLIEDRDEPFRQLANRANFIRPGR